MNYIMRLRVNMESKKNFFENRSYAAIQTNSGIINKCKIVTEKHARITKYHSILKNEPNLFNEKFRFILEREVFIFCEEIYSCLDYYSYILRHYQENSDKYRGQSTPTGFNDVLKGYINKRSKAIYKNKEIDRLFGNAVTWYPIIHDIRSKEIHCCMGEVKIIDNGLWYESMTRYDKYGEVKIDISDLQNIYYKFDIFIKEALDLLNDCNI